MDESDYISSQIIERVKELEEFHDYGMNAMTQPGITITLTLYKDKDAFGGVNWVGDVRFNQGESAAPSSVDIRSTTPSGALKSVGVWLASAGANVILKKLLSSLI